MVATIIRRLLIVIPQIFIISLVIFGLAWIMPGDFVSQRRMMEEHVTLNEILLMRERFGLDDPWYQQYLRWLGSALRGDFGMSFQHGRPVVDLVRINIGNTFRLSLASTILAFSIAIPFGILAGRYSRRWPDKAIILYGFIGLALPAIVIAILLAWLFAFQLQWLPFRGSIDPLVYGTGFVPETLSRLRHIILPASSLALGGGIGTIYFLRAQIIEGKNSEYAMTAKANGIPEKRIFSRHILRNSLIPFAPTVGFIFAGLFTGSILIERIYAYPGMGQLFFTAIAQRDQNVVIGVALFYSVIFVVAVLIGDIVLTIVDPRIRMK